MDDLDAIALAALDQLANCASLAADQAEEPQRSNSVRSDASGTGDSDAADHSALRRPSARANQRSEKQAPQKWVQCAKCNLWRKVPFTLHDEDISEDWECANNVWDKAYASCAVPQALSDNEIDNILAKQQSELEAEAPLHLDALEEYHPELYPVRANQEEPEGDLGDDGLDGAMREDSGLSSRRGSANRQRATVKGRRGRATRGPGRSAEPPESYQPPGAFGRGRGFRGQRTKYDEPEPAGSSRGVAMPDMLAFAGRSAARGLTVGRKVPTTRGGFGGRGVPGGRALGSQMGSWGPPTAAGRGRGRIARGLSEAAEALLDMGVLQSESRDKEGTEMEGDDGDESAPASPNTAGAFRPGRVVWAKVEGHDWWPARIVRRRAVPKEVGPPPGIAAGTSLEVQSHIPVVFFTATGLPGEVGQDVEGVADVLPGQLQQQHGRGAEETTAASADEAEYAWLTQPSLKPFKSGDLSGDAEGPRTGDVNLQACVAAAERAMRSNSLQEEQRRKRLAEVDADHAVKLEAEEDGSDSDGGWGAPSPTEAGIGRARGRGGRGGRGRRGRGRGSRRGGRVGRRGGRSGGLDDDASDSDPDAQEADASGSLPSQPSQPGKILVESILGWRHGSAGLDVSGRGDVGPQTPRPGSARAGAGTVSSSRKQAPQDAVDVLLGCHSSGEIDEDEPATPVTQQQGEAGESGDAQYLVKWVARSHLHNEWVPGSLLLRLAKRKLVNFKRRYGASPCLFMQDAWRIAERLVARRPSPGGPGWELLVKWADLDYSECTWEVEGEALVTQPAYSRLHSELWNRQWQALQRCKPTALVVAASQRRAAEQQLVDLDRKPPEVAGCALYPHQLQSVNWMRRCWVSSQPMLLADEMGLGKTASVICFIQCLRHEFAAVLPILVAVPTQSLPYWEAEWAFWGKNTNVIPYAGSLASRTILMEHELYLNASSLDGKLTGKLKDEMPPEGQVMKADVVLVSHEALVSDVSMLKGMAWEAVLVDERDRAPSALAKAYQAVSELETPCRLVLYNAPPEQSSAEALLSTISFLQPHIQELSDLPGGEQAAELDDAAQVHFLAQAVQPWLLRRLRADTGAPPPPRREVWVPVCLTPVQRAAYCSVLVRNVEILTDPKPPRHAGHRAAQMRCVCTELRKVCAHPYLMSEVLDPADGFEPALAVQASAKLTLLHQLLPLLQRAGRHVLLLSQSHQMMDILEQLCQQLLGPDAVERVDASSPSAQMHKAVLRFNAPGSACCVFIMDTRSCGLGTSLPSIDLVIIHDSEWNQHGDLQAIGRARCLGQASPEKPASQQPEILRLLVQDTAEERALQHTDKPGGYEAMFKSGLGSRASAGSVRLLEDTIRAGTSTLFAGFSATQSPGSQTGMAPQAPDYNPQALISLVERLRPGHLAGAAGQEAIPLGPGLERLSVRHRGPPEADPVKREVEEGEESGAEDGAEDDGEDAEYGTKSAAKSATFWEGVLRHHHNRLQQAEEAALAQAPAQPRRAPAAPADSALPRRESMANSLELDDDQAMEDGPALGPSTADVYDPADDVSGGHYRGRVGGRGRGGRGRGAWGRGRTVRRKRPDLDDEDVAALEEPPLGKRRRREVKTEAGMDGDLLRQEAAHVEAALHAVHNQNTPEHALLMTALQRLSGLAQDLKIEVAPLLEYAAQLAQILLVLRKEGEPLPARFQDYTLLALIAAAAQLCGLGGGSDEGVAALAMRYQQDYQNVLQARDLILAKLLHYRSLHSHLQNLVTRASPSDTGQLADGDSQQEQTPRGIVLTVRTGTDGKVAAAEAPGLLLESSGRGVQPLDAFVAKLTQIVAADYSVAAMQTPLDLSPFPVPALPQDVERNNPALAAEFGSVMKNLKGLTTQIALLDRIHSIKVKHIQEEYQKYMEKVRGKAQGSIDQANLLFQARRHDLTGHVDNIVAFMQQRFLSVQGTGLQLASSLGHLPPELQGQSQPQSQPGGSQAVTPGQHSGQHNSQRTRVPSSAKAAPQQPPQPPPQPRPSSEEPVGSDWESGMPSIPQQQPQLQQQHLQQQQQQQGLAGAVQPSRSGLGSASSSKPSPPEGGAGVEQDAQGDGSQAQFYASQPLPSLSAYRPSEDQLEKLTKHMERQAAMGELPWPLGAQGGLKGIVASHQVIHPGLKQQQHQQQKPGMAAGQSQDAGPPAAPTAVMGPPRRLQAALQAGIGLSQAGGLGDAASKAAQDAKQLALHRGLGGLGVGSQAGHAASGPPSLLLAGTQTTFSAAHSAAVQQQGGSQRLPLNLLTGEQKQDLALLATAQHLHPPSQAGQARAAGAGASVPEGAAAAQHQQGAPLMSSRPAQYQPKPAQQPEQLTALDLAMQPDQAWASHQPHRDQGAPLQESRPQGTAQPASHPDAARFNGRQASGGGAATLGDEMAHTALEQHLNGSALQRHAQHFQGGQLRGLHQALPGAAGFVPGTLTIKPPLAGHKAIQLASSRRRSPPPAQARAQAHSQAQAQGQAQARAQSRERSPQHVRAGHPPAAHHMPEAQPHLQQQQIQASELPGRPGPQHARPESAGASQQQGRQWQRSPSRERLPTITDTDPADLPF